MSHIFANDAKSFTFVNDYGDGSEIRFEDPHYLTVQLLEENWKTYKYLLSVYTEYRNMNNITEEKIQENSTIPLSMIVGIQRMFNPFLSCW